MTPSRPVYGQETIPQLPEDYDVRIRAVIPFYQEMHQETVNLVRMYNGQPTKWLDTGCGTGSLVAKASLIFPETEFILADPSEGMLALAQKKLQRRQNVRFLSPATTQSLEGIEDASLDVVTAIQCHHYQGAEMRIEAVARCFELLKEGGIFVVSENIRPFTEVGIEVGKRYLAQFQRGYGRKEEEIASYLSRFDREYFPITVQEHLDLLRAQGFRRVEMLWYSYMQAAFYAIK
ncbi:MAG: ubiquinone/menaquinone biosynthesis methyltransferase [Methanomassiliicoccales archaeon PtaU1.Bin124]|nr:MAG: ubiquinone/menaquinone biosynthesis methyltransferase [Methanomassiliicoccales archaeon PtaU1.Bin124]